MRSTIIVFVKSTKAFVSALLECPYIDTIKLYADENGYIFCWVEGCPDHLFRFGKWVQFFNDPSLGS